MITNFLIAIALVFQTTNFNSKLSFDYPDDAILENAITHFLVCVDGQPTSSCSKLDVFVNGVIIGGVSTGIPTATPGLRTYTFIFPALKAGPHKVAVQACNLNSVTCSSGTSLDFTATLVIPNVSNMRLVK